MHRPRAWLTAVNGNATAQPVKLAFGGLARHFYQICLLHARRGLRQLICQLTIVGYQQQTFAHVVQAAHRVKAFAHLLKERHHRRPAFRILNCGDEALRLVQNKIAMPLGPVQQLAVDADVIAPSIGFGTQLRDDGAVHLHAATCNHLFCLAPARNSCLRQDLLQALHLCWRSRFRRSLLINFFCFCLRNSRLARIEPRLIQLGSFGLTGNRRDSFRSDGGSVAFTGLSMAQLNRLIIPEIRLAFAIGGHAQWIFNARGRGRDGRSCFARSLWLGF
jgi:hypothetical protein